MNLRHRLDVLEEEFGRRGDVTVTIVLDGVDDESCRARADEARRLGRKIRVIRIGITAVAETVEEAEVKVAEHRAAGSQIPISIHRAGSMGSEILASWNPGVPNWLGGDGHADRDTDAGAVGDADGDSGESGETSVPA